MNELGAKKVFREELILCIGGRIYSLATLVLFWGMWLYIDSMASGELQQEFSFFEQVATGIFLLLSIFVQFYCLKRVFWERSWGKLIVTPSGVTFRCLLKRPRHIAFEETFEIGVADYRKHYRGEGIEKEDLYIETTPVAIYFSKKPYPEEYNGLVDMLHVSDDFVKFCYSDGLCRTILDIAPRNKTGNLMWFYSTRTRRLKGRKKSQNKKRK